MEQQPPILLRFPQAPVVRDALSAVVQIGDTLWLANDESACLECLSRPQKAADGGWHYTQHSRFALHDHLSLPIAPAAKGSEVDVEGLAFHDGYLWLVGSHSLKRSEPDTDKSVEKNIKKLASIARDANRYLLARIPVSLEGGNATLQQAAAQLPMTLMGNTLLDALHGDPHLGVFLNIPGKDNGFDIEGLAVAGKRLFLGLRGPVLRGWAIILELEMTPDPANPHWLQLCSIGEEGRLYRKHFLPLEGLGIRDLCIQGDDLLILAGPTMSLDEPVRLYRWQGGAKPSSESLVAESELHVVADIPAGKRDHAEGMTLFQQAHDKATVLVVYDKAAKNRKRGDDGVLGDLFRLGW